MEEHLKAAGCEKKALTDANRELERAEVNTMNSRVNKNKSNSAGFSSVTSDLQTVKPTESRNTVMQIV